MGTFFNNLKSDVEGFLEDLPAELKKAEVEVANLEAKLATGVSKAEALVAQVEQDAPALLPLVQDLLTVLKVV
jgi:hypothetical protein